MYTFFRKPYLTRYVLIFLKKLRELRVHYRKTYKKITNRWKSLKARTISINQLKREQAHWSFDRSDKKVFLIIIFKKLVNSIPIIDNLFSTQVFEKRDKERRLQ